MKLYLKGKPDMAKIGILIKNLQVGGAQKQSIMLGQILKKEHDLTFIVFNGEPISERLLSLAYAYGISPHILLGSLFKRLIDFYLIVKNNNIDILFTYLAGDNLIGGIVGKISGAKYIVGGIRSSRIEPVKMFVQRTLTNNLFAYTVFNNQSGMDAMINKGFKRKKCVLIENSIDFTREPFTRPEKKEITVITIARFEEMKDFQTAIKAVHYLTSQNRISKGKSIRYYIIGKGTQTEFIEKWILSYGMQQNIRIIKEPPDIERYLLEADLYLSTSLFEGISNSIMEALLHSIPVVATNVGDNCRLVVDSYNGFLIPVNDAEQAALKLEYLINNYNKRIEFGLNGYSLLRERFSHEKFTGAYNQIISSLKC